MPKQHKLVHRQIHKHLSAWLTTAPRDVQNLVNEFCVTVQNSYDEYESQLNLLKCAIDLNSQEYLIANREMSLQNNELKYMYQIALLIHGHGSSRLVMPMVAKKVAGATGFPIVAIELYDNKANGLRLHSILGAGDLGIDREGALLSIENSPYVDIFSDGSDAYVTSDFQQNPMREKLWADLNVGSLVCVPLKTRSHIWGTMTIAHPETNQASSNLGKWLQTVAGQIAAKLETERLNELNEQQQAFVLASSKMSELGKMAGGIAHEINTPLTTILLQTTVLLETAAEKNHDTLVAPLQTITKTVERIAQIVKGLRTFSRDGSNDRFFPVNLSQVISNTVALSGEKFRHNSVELRVNCAANVEVQCRETQISQLLLNLISNAYDAVSTLPEKWVAIDVADLGPCIQIDVTDSGSGIPMEAQEKLFLPFYTTKEVGEGTGLGLSIAMGIVDAHSGRIELDTQSKNTRFVIYLPKDPQLLKANAA
jgi:signal transduction histidine kinase